MLKVYKIEIITFLLFVSLLLYFSTYFKFNEILHAPSFMRNVAVKLAPHTDERHFESIKKVIRLENTGVERKPPANTTLTPSTIRISNLYSVSLKTYVQAIIDRSLTIQSKYGFIFLQMMNSAFLLHTKSWLCNVKNQNEVLQRLILIATDDHAFKQLKAFNVKVLHLFLLPYESLDLEYGLRSYYEYVLFRISLTNKILNADVSVWICEADAVWFESPIKYLIEFTEKDIVVQQDGLINQNMPCGGFIFLNKTKPTRRMWRELEKRVTTVLNSLTDVEVGDEGNEQLMLPNLLSEFRVKWAFFSRTNFVSGHWYTNELFRTQVHPVVIQNNWIKGNEAKILRAKYWDHWFLNQNETCL